MSDHDILKPLSAEGYEVLNGSYIWTIDDFPDKLGNLYSPLLSVGFRNEVELRLNLLEFTNVGEFWYGVEVSVENVINPVPESKNKTYRLKHGVSIIHSSEKPGSRWTHKTYISSLEKNRSFRLTVIGRRQIINNSKYYLPNNKLTILYMISLHDSSSESDALSTKTVSSDFKAILENSKGSDVTFLVDSQEFQAHKLIVSTRSPVFSAMFDTEMKESQERKVTIEDIGTETFKELLCFMYTDEVEDLEKNAYELLEAATKYDLPKLKFMCIEKLLKNLDPENCTAIFSAADVYSCTKLKQHTLNFIVDNAASVMKTPGYELLAKSYPHLLSEAFQAVLTKWCNK